VKLAGLAKSVVVQSSKRSDTLEVSLPVFKSSNLQVFIKPSAPPVLCRFNKVKYAGAHINRIWHSNRWASPAPAPRQRTPHIFNRPAHHHRPAGVTFTVTLTGGQIPLGRPIPRGGLP